MALLEDIVETITEASDLELNEWLKEIRHNRTQETFVVEKKERKKKAVKNILDGMTPAQAAELLKLLGSA